jgi:hypothetical protein
MTTNFVWLLVEPSRTRLLLLPMLVTCSALMTACGGHDYVAKTRAVAFATTVNLRGGDVPGMAILAPGSEARVNPPFGKCVTQLRPDYEVVAVNSARFLRSRGQRSGRTGHIVRPGLPPIEGVHSTVLVMGRARRRESNRGGTTRCGGS